MSTKTSTAVNGVNGLSDTASNPTSVLTRAELDLLRREIIGELRKEVLLAKNEILDSKSAPLIRKNHIFPSQPFLLSQASTSFHVVVVGKVHIEWKSHFIN